MGPRSVIMLIGAALLFLFVLLELASEEMAGTSNLFVFLLVNLNILILGTLIFLVGRNVAKLIFDRKKNLLGSQLRMRLVVAFVGLALIPTTILFFFASGLLTRSMQGWFSNPVEDAITGSLEIARLHYASMRQEQADLALQVKQEIEARPLLITDSEMFRSFLSTRRKERGVFSIEVLSKSGEVLFESRNAASLLEAFRSPGPDEASLKRVAQGEVFTIFEEHGAGQFIRSYLPINLTTFSAALVLTSRIDPELSHAFASVNESFAEYQQLKLFKNPLRSGYTLTLGMITALILFSAIWIGFYIAREIAVPVQRLAEGMHAVAHGNYDYKIRVTGEDEIGFLTKSFNTMTADLKSSTQEAARRKLYIESILANLVVGVLALDREGKITAANQVAADLFEIKSEENEVLGRALQEVLSDKDFKEIKPLLAESAKIDSSQHGSTRLLSNPFSLEKQIRIVSNGREHKIIVTAGKIADEQGQRIGTLLLFDDITELAKAQQMAAWKEVARRIAHEIKNPLTPIQLSAQRIQRLIGEGDFSSDSIVESSQTIVENVASIKRLANEFSNFARMPTSEFEPSDINLLISDTIAPFADNHPEMLMQFIAEPDIPDIFLDREQIRRIIMNLIDNSIAALSESNAKASNQAVPKILLRSFYDKRKKTVRVEIGDNGPGIKDTDKVRIFEPYFTTKKNGTGLGLAIVTSVVSEHQGEIRVYDNVPCGVKFIIDLPLSPQRQRSVDSADVTPLEVT